MQVYNVNANGTQGNKQSQYSYSNSADPNDDARDQLYEYIVYQSDGTTIHSDRTNFYSADGTVKQVNSIINQGGTDT